MGAFEPFWQHGVSLGIPLPPHRPATSEEIPLPIRLLCLGDIVGRPGRRIIRRQLKALREDRAVDVVLANGENAAGGSGLTPKILQELLRGGVDLVTSGDHIYKNKEVFGCIDHERLLRPLNYVPAAAGRGHTVLHLDSGLRLGVVNLVGRVFMEPAECPFQAIDTLLAGHGDEAAAWIVDFHAEATSEKIAMAWHLAGRVAAVVGSHTHVQTADERILPGGTAAMSDLGMTGSHAGVIGRTKESVLHRFTTQMPARFDICDGDVRLQGVLVDLDPETGQAAAATRLSVEEAEEEKKEEADAPPA